jgi:hypothetical protein
MNREETSRSDNPYGLEAQSIDPRQQSQAGFDPFKGYLDTMPHVHAGLMGAGGNELCPLGEGHQLFFGHGPTGAIQQ